MTPIVDFRCLTIAYWVKLQAGGNNHYGYYDYDKIGSLLNVFAFGMMELNGNRMLIFALLNTNGEGLAWLTGSKHAAIIYQDGEIVVKSVTSYSVRDVRVNKDRPNLPKFNGLMSQLLVYNKALSRDEVLLLGRPQHRAPPRNFPVENAPPKQPFPGPMPTMHPPQSPSYADVLDRRKSLMDDNTIMKLFKLYEMIRRPALPSSRRRAINLSCWNINGLSTSSVFDNKLNHPDFLCNVKNCDLLVISEIWGHEALDIPGFDTIVVNSPKKINTKKAGRSSGGILVAAASSFSRSVSVFKQEKDYIWCKLDKRLLSLDEDIFICACYIPPSNSPYFDDEVFSNLENDIALFKGHGKILLLGDMNARTGNLRDYPENTDSRHTVDHFYPTPADSLKRKNLDSQINSNGKSLIELCKALDLRILNGKTKGDSLGKLTFNGRLGFSTIDYMITDHDFLSSFESFIVSRPSPLSDHSLLIGRLNISSPYVDDRKAATNLLKLPIQFAWRSDSKEKFTDALSSLENAVGLDPVLLPNGVPLNSLFYADDLVLISTSASGLQKSINLIDQFCKDWLMSVNQKKTKVVIIQKQCRKLNLQKFRFFLNGSQLDNVTEYKYLGCTFTTNGNFTTSKLRSVEKTRRSIFAVKRYLNFNRFPIKLNNKLFNALFSPILLYNSDVWGAYDAINFQKWETDPIERLHCQFFKYYFGLNKRAPNVSARNEAGRLSLKSTILRNTLLFWLHIQALPENGIAKQCLKISSELTCSGKSSFMSSLYVTHVATSIQRAWFGGSDMATEGQYLSTYSGSPKVTYLNWAPGHQDKDSQDCLAGLVHIVNEAIARHALALAIRLRKSSNTIICIAHGQGRIAGYRFLRYLKYRFRCDVIHTLNGVNRDDCRNRCANNLGCYALNTIRGPNGTEMCELLRPRTDSRYSENDCFIKQENSEHNSLLDVDHCPPDKPCSKRVKKVLDGGWYQFGTNAWKLFTRNLNWEAAVSACTAEGAELTPVTHALDAKFLAEAMLARITATSRPREFDSNHAVNSSTKGTNKQRVFQIPNLSISQAMIFSTDADAFTVFTFALKSFFFTEHF
ncbi:predicted protein [Nematostella vectensis]|uniref:Apple domain-containing protein n=1 Tax=Nematostella vectensis TaxID=45351 RepID=A7SDI1_NEMVE|nr:predicted protein [Nematostella vectensis]|eukprot:XP_001630327.1 predicted protein [Nematostella vectensis]